MKKEHGDRLARALEFANESAEYHVRNYAGGTLMPGDAYADLPIDERDRVFLGRAAGAPDMYSRIYRSQRGSTGEPDRMPGQRMLYQDTRMKDCPVIFREEAIRRMRREGQNGSGYE